MRLVPSGGDRTGWHRLAQPGDTEIKPTHDPPRAASSKVVRVGKSQGLVQSSHLSSTGDIDAPGKKSSSPCGNGGSRARGGQRESGPLAAGTGL